MSENLISALIGALVGAVVGPLASWLLEIINRRRLQREVAAALRFEIAANVLWLDTILDSRNYLRDESYVKMKNNGYISYLNSPLPMMIARTYDIMYSLNRQILVMRKSESVTEKTRNEVIIRIDDLRLMSKDLLNHFDQTYPRIGRNFKEKAMRTA